MTVQTRKRRNKLLVPLLIILGLMVFMVLYTTRVIQDVAVSNIQEDRRGDHESGQAVRRKLHGLLWLYQGRIPGRSALAAPGGL